MNEVLLMLVARPAGRCLFECLCGKLGAALRYLDVIFVPFVCIIIYLCVCVFIYVQYTEHIKRERIKRERLAHASMKVYAVASAIPRESLALRLTALCCLSVYVSHNPKFELWGGPGGLRMGGRIFTRFFILREVSRNGTLALYEGQLYIAIGRSYELS